MVFFVSFGGVGAGADTASFRFFSFARTGQATGMFLIKNAPIHPANYFLLTRKEGGFHFLTPQAEGGERKPPREAPW